MRASPMRTFVDAAVISSGVGTGGVNGINKRLLDNDLKMKATFNSLVLKMYWDLYVNRTAQE